MTLHIEIIGYGLIILSLIHIVFPRYFKWSTEFSAISLVNREMMYIHTFFIALVLLLMGLLCITSSFEIVHEPLGRKIALGLGLFWTIRLIIQWFGYSMALWRGKIFETAIHIIFTLFWSYMSYIFLATWMGK